MELRQTQWSLPVCRSWINSPETTSKFCTGPSVGRWKPLTAPLYNNLFPTLNSCRNRLILSAEDFLKQTVRLEGLPYPLRPQLFSVHTVPLRGLPGFWRIQKTQVCFFHLLTEFFFGKIHFKLQNIRKTLTNSVEIACTLHKFHTRGAPTWRMSIYGNMDDVRWKPRISPCDLFLKTLNVNCSWDQSRLRPVPYENSSWDSCRDYSLRVCRPLKSRKGRPYDLYADRLCGTQEGTGPCNKS